MWIHGGGVDDRNLPGGPGAFASVGGSSADHVRG